VPERSGRRDRDSKKRNRKNLVLEFVGRFVACSDTRHYKTVRSRRALSAHTHAPTFAAQQSKTIDRLLLVAYRWLGANAASMLLTSHGNEREHRRLLLTHIWSQGDLEAQVVSCKADATRWIFVGSRVRAAGVRAPVQVAVSERAVRVTMSGRSVVFDLSNTNSVATVFRLLDITETITGLKCFTSCSSARASFSTAYSLPLAVPAAPGSVEPRRSAHPSVLPMPSSLPPSMAFPAAGRAGQVGNTRHPLRQLGVANVARSRGAYCKTSARQRAPAT